MVLTGPLQVQIKGPAGIYLEEEVHCKTPIGKILILKAIAVPSLFNFLKIIIIVILLF
jgi:hypothetical protein